ncbi:MFS transporter [Marininema halotolerans]|uniref:MFS transporter n=1 Tax=Marininema halotolerans TaxID=1155944 RepID=UPI001C3CCD98|nr:MFS transporter [Marininema halotolerans]
MNNKNNLLFKNRNYRYLWMGQAGSVMGDYFNQVAIMSTALHLSNSVLSISYLLMLRMLPSVIIGPFMGPLVDRFHKVKTMIIADLFRGIVTLSFIVAFLKEEIWILYVGSFFIGILSSFFNPARQSVQPLIVSRDRIAEANAWSTATYSVMTIVGSILGGVVSAIFSPLLCFILNGLSYFWSAWCIKAIQLPKKGKPDRLPYRQALIEGFKEATQNRVVRSILLIGISWGIAGGGYLILIPLLGKNVYQMNGIGIGLLYGVDGLGVLTGAYVVKACVRDRHQRAVVWYGASYIVQAVFFACLTQTSTFFFGVLLLYAMRICSGIIIPLDTYMVQTYTTESRQGRVFALHMATYGGVMQLSYIVSGVAYEKYGIPLVGVGIGVVSLLCGASWLTQYYQGKFTSPKLSIREVVKS